uniref:Ribonuclease P protein component 1 n=1 Tax=Ignisphaera aggregans TaxID=334771 RepID=A0A7J3YU04_9CREN
MLRTKDNIIYHEIIGLRVKILSHLDPTLVGREGIVINETMNTLQILDTKHGKVIKVPKRGGIFLFTIPEANEELIIDGMQIFGRPEDRLKKIRFTNMRR